MALTGVEKTSIGYIFKFDLDSQAEAHLYKNRKRDIIRPTPFLDWVADNYQDLLTESQIKYLALTEQEKREQHSKQNRYCYRQNIQKTLFKAYFGFNMTYYRKLEDDLYAYLFCRQGLKITSKEEFSDYLVNHLEYHLVHDFLYNTLPTEERLQVFEYQEHKTPIPNDILSKFYKLLQKVKRSRKESIFTHKKEK